MQRLGKYELLGELASGGMAAVYRARDTTLDREVALKVINKELLDGGEDGVRRFLHEAKVAGGLTHPNIVVIYELGVEKGAPFIAMEYLPGRDLRELISDRTPLTLGQKVGILLQVARALHFAHSRGVIHRDVKPANIRLLPSGVVKLLDFGIAKLTTEGLSRVTRVGTLVGSAAYMSPEQAQAKPLTPASDVFSFGIVVQELLTFRKPFVSSDAVGLLYQIVHTEASPIDDEDIPPELIALVSSCLKKSARDRPQSFDPIVKKLVSLQQELRITEAKRPLVSPLDVALASAAQAPTESSRSRDPGGAGSPGMPQPAEVVGPSRAAQGRRLGRVPPAVYAAGIAIGIPAGLLVGSLGIVALATAMSWLGGTSEPPPSPPKRPTPVVWTAAAFSPTAVASAPAAAAPSHTPAPRTSTPKVPVEISVALSQPTDSPVEIIPTPTETERPTERPSATPTKKKTSTPKKKATATPTKPRGTPSPTRSARPSPRADRTQRAVPANAGSVSISASPWAYVTIDGSDAEEQTPIVSLSLSKGQHRLVMRREGFYPIEQTFEVQTGEPLRLDFVLTPMQSGTVTIVLTAPEWAYFKIDNGEQRELPHAALTLPEGRHTLLIYREGFRPLERKVEVRPNAAFSMSVKLEPGPPGSGASKP